MIKNTKKTGVAIVFALTFGTMAMAQTTILDDFSETSAPRWSYVADTVMGGVSDGSAEIGRDGDRDFIKLTGKVSTDNNGGFIQVRRDLAGGFAKNTLGLTVTARGNGETYYVFLRSRKGTRPWHSYRATFVAGDDWADTKLIIANFEPSRSELPPKILPEDVVGIGLVAYGKAFKADLEVAQIDLF